MSRFEDLRLIDPLLRALKEEGYVHPTPIQERTIETVLDGRDLLGCAQTGTGKTAAFALPILQRLHESPSRGQRHVRVLVLSPTRELAAQIGGSFTAYGRHLNIKHTVIFGGVGQRPQEQALNRGVDVLIATPGRLLDLMGQRIAQLGRVEILVLDEADRMLDMGFIHDVRRIVSALPRKRQTIFYSATLPRDIQSLARDILSNPVRVEVTPPATTVEKIAQSLYHVNKADKFTLLAHLLKDGAFRRTLVFTRTKRGANRVAEKLAKSRVQADAIHGNKGQGARERAMDNFKRGATRVLVATDIAARGIDVDDITHVINFDLPDVPEVYVHRIGRTARAGAGGIAITFCGPDERSDLAAIERLIRTRLPVKPLPQGMETAPAHSASGQPRHFTPKPSHATGSAPAPWHRHSRGQDRNRQPGRHHEPYRGPSQSRHADPQNRPPQGQQHGRHSDHPQGRHHSQHTGRQQGPSRYSGKNRRRW